MTTIDAVGLTKVYREGSIDVVAVKDVSVSAYPGEIVGVMGPSGSGKTTLLSMLGCILRPTHGKISLCGEQVADLDESALPLVRRRHVGFIFQSFNLFAALTATENVQVVLNLKGRQGRAGREEALRLLEVVGLADRANFLPRDLSGGEKQRVSIARALAGEPHLILADEPTASLDGKNGEHVMRLLREAADAVDRAVIVVTHDHRVVPYMDRLVHLEDGRRVG